MPDHKTPLLTPGGARTYAAFDGHRLIATGALLEVALVVKAAIEGCVKGPVLAFDGESGAVVDLDLRGTETEIATRLARQGTEEEPAGSAAKRAEDAGVQGSEARPARGRGRPALGVVAREVTLLPRHWEWLAAQKGGASVTLRRLVDEARRADGGRTRMREMRESAYRFMSATAGDLPGFEEAARALFADDRKRFERLTAAWPFDVRKFACELAWGDRRGTEHNRGPE
jgi:uncharacterized protein